MPRVRYSSMASAKVGESPIQRLSTPSRAPKSSPARRRERRSTEAQAVHIAVGVSAVSTDRTRVARPSAPAPTRRGPRARRRQTELMRLSFGGDLPLRSERESCAMKVPPNAEREPARRARRSARASYPVTTLGVSRTANDLVAAAPRCATECSAAGLSAAHLADSAAIPSRQAASTRRTQLFSLLKPTRKIHVSTHGPFA